MADNRSVIRIQVDSSGQAELKRICAKRGMTQVAVVSRLVNWFIRQDDVIQTAVMSQLSEPAMSQLARQTLKRIASGASRNSK